MATVRIKICGVTTPEDARFAAEAGADAVGLNFYPEVAAIRYAAAGRHDRAGAAGVHRSRRRVCRDAAAASVCSGVPTWPSWRSDLRRSADG